jgi:uncharacterized protein YqgC (DUF456 family)
MWEAVLLFVLAAGLVMLGLIGLVFPAVPGAPLLFLGLVLAAWAEEFTFVGIGTLSLLAGLALLTYVVDIAAGAFGAKRFGASPRAMIGAGIGALLGLFFGLPGVLFGPFIGAAVGELSMQRSLGAASRAGLGATLGLVLGAAAKIALAFSMIGIYVLARIF